MSHQFRMPALSPTMEKGSIAKWLVKVGDEIRPGDLIAEIETDKATMEVEAVDEGFLVDILVPEGTDDVLVGTALALIGDAPMGAAREPAPPPSAKVQLLADPQFAETAAPCLAGEGRAPEARVEPGRIKASPLARRIASDRGVDLAKLTGSGPGGRIVKADFGPAGLSTTSGGDRIVASPLAKRIAGARGIDLGSVKGSGPNGRIVKADLDLAGRSAPQAAPAAPSVAPVTAQDFGIPHVTQKLSSMRKTIARRLSESKQQIPHIYLTVDIRLDALLRLRGEINAALAPQGIKLSVNDLLIKALARALIAVPECNVQFAGDQMLQFSRTDISVAVSIEGGLITPIVADAGSKSVSAISTEMADLAARARDGKLQPHEYQGGTASLSNMGMYGIKQFDAVINPPQAMIMAIGAGEKRPFVIDDALSLATVMSATGSFDHRAIDGADAARLMQSFRQFVEQPLALLA